MQTLHEALLKTVTSMAGPFLGEGHGTCRERPAAILLPNSVASRRMEQDSYICAAAERLGNKGLRKTKREGKGRQQANFKTGALNRSAILRCPAAIGRIGCAAQTRSVWGVKTCQPPPNHHHHHAVEGGSPCRCRASPQVRPM